jgi:hypothetical protein
MGNNIDLVIKLLMIKGFIKPSPSHQIYYIN